MITLSQIDSNPDLCYFFPLVIDAEWRIYASVNLAIIGSDNGLLPGRRQAFIRTNDGILLIRTSVKSKMKFMHFYSRNAI